MACLLTACIFAVLLQLELRYRNVGISKASYESQFPPGRAEQQLGGKAYPAGPTFQVEFESINAERIP